MSHARTHTFQTIRPYLPFVGAILFAVAFIFGGDVLSAYAQDFGLTQLDPGNFGLRGDSPASFFGSIIQWVLGVLGVVLVGLIIYGGVMYMTSAGNTQRVESGKQILTWAIIGIVIVMAAFIISQFVVGALTAGGTSAGGTGGTTGSSTNPFGRDWCTADDDPKLRDQGFYCDYGIGGYDTQGTIRRRDQDYFFYEASLTRETNLPERTDEAIFGTNP